MRTRPHFALALVLVVGLLSGCGKSGSNMSPSSSTGSSGTAVQQADVAAVMAQTPEVIEDGEFETPDVFATEQMALDAGARTLGDSIKVLHWWRTTRHVERSFTFAFSDTDSAGVPTQAIVTIHKHIEGTLHILARAVPDTGGGEGMPSAASWNDTTRLQHIKKATVDNWVRRVMLVRIDAKPARHGDGDDQGEDNDAVAASFGDDQGDHDGNGHGHRPRWRVVATSGVDVTSEPSTTTIQSIRVQAGALDTTLTDPLAFWRLRRLHKANPMEPVTITVTTGRSDDLVFLFSRGGRRTFHNNGDGTYSGTWHAPMLRGIRHFGVNALSNGTLNDNAAAYDSKAWIIPYVTSSNDWCDYLPRD